MLEGCSRGLADAARRAPRARGRLPRGAPLSLRRVACHGRAQVPARRARTSWRARSSAASRRTATVLRRAWSRDEAVTEWIGASGVVVLRPPALDKATVRRRPGRAPAAEVDALPVPAPRARTRRRRSPRSGAAGALLEAELERERAAAGLSRGRAAVDRHYPGTALAVRRPPHPQTDSSPTRLDAACLHGRARARRLSRPRRDPAAARQG